MIFHDIDQYSPDWYTKRAGIPTASQFHRIITKTGKLSSQADDYANQLIAELLLQKPINQNFLAYALEWGHVYEKQALEYYSLQTGYDVSLGGFFTTNDHTIGASPDGRVFENGQMIGITEIKCPANPTIHVKYLLLNTMNEAYKPQVQGQLMITECEWSDWFTYHPEIQSGCVKIYRDEDYIKLLSGALDSFLELMQRKKERLIEIGAAEQLGQFKIEHIKNATTKPLYNKELCDALYGVS